MYVGLEQCVALVDCFEARPCGSHLVARLSCAASYRRLKIRAEARVRFYNTAHCSLAADNHRLMMMYRYLFLLRQIANSMFVILDYRRDCNRY